MKKLGYLLVGCLWAIGLAAGCSQENRLVIYADPWLAEFTDSMCQEFKRQHPDVEIHLKTISSEVIAQHIRFGQPVDVFLCFGSEWLQRPDFQEKVAREAVLAPSRVIELLQQDTLYRSKQAAMKTGTATMMEASDRPLRRYTDLAGFGDGSDRATVAIANFQSQAVDYLLRGWVPAGFVPLHFARKQASRFKTVRTGPLIPRAFTAILLANAPNPTLAEEFWLQTRSEKSRTVLAKLGFLP